MARQDTPEMIAEKQGVFLEGLAEGMTIEDAAIGANSSRSQVYRWRKSDPEFATAWNDAYAIGASTLEAAAQRRAVDGTRRPVFHQGEVCGHITEYSDTLLIFLLKARDPERFCDKTRTAKIEREIAEALAKSNSNATTTAAEIVARLERLATEKAALADK